MICTGCKKEANFRLNKSTGRSFSRCIDCQNKLQREYRDRLSNSPTKTYEKTERGYIMRMYRNMKSRVTGIQKVCANKYKGLDILPKEDFYTWINASSIFKELFKIYEENNYLQRLSPTVDRINPEYGYTLDNMRLMNLSDNVKLARPTTKLSCVDVVNIRELLKTKSVKEVANLFDISITVTYNIKNYKTFKRL